MQHLQHLRHGDIGGRAQNKDKVAQSLLAMLRFCSVFICIVCGSFAMLSEAFHLVTDIATFFVSISPPERRSRGRRQLVLLLITSYRIFGEPACRLFTGKE
ncbi:hypothetical protein BC830DRAFT_1140094 [Chytriomyces sp. MP71]|nr:hypothetical protein BC830DRAFT_1140094 [Chytriomyces sp. MP71]